MDNFKKYIVEFIGTFFLVLTVGMVTLLPGNGVIPAIAIGLILMIMVYSGGYISGGHYNPVVSLAAALSGSLSGNLLIPYIISQVLGSILASIVIMTFCELPAITTCPYSLLQVFVGEVIFTFALCYVVLLTATTNETKGNSYYGLAIGSTVAVGAFVAGGVICYGAFNPAVAIGLFNLHISCMGLTLLTIFSNIIGSILAAYTFKYITK